jgi:uncharacterized membrane protein
MPSLHGARGLHPDDIEEMGTNRKPAHEAALGMVSLCAKAAVQGAEQGTSRARSSCMISAQEAASRILPSQRNVASPERWGSIIAGVALASWGLARRNVSGSVVALLGGALLWRGATGKCPIYKSLGISTRPDSELERSVSVPYGRGIRVEHSIIVDAVPERLYEFWRNLANLPRFMRHLESVEVYDPKHSHWVAKGPAGFDAEWDAEIINEIPNELIGWRSVDGANVDNAGSVHFTPATGGGTEVRVLLRYDPPAGKLGAAFAKLFGENPANQIQEDLRAFKQLVESGRHE